MLRKRLVDYLVYLLVRILICVVQTMRLDTCQRLARRLAWLFTDLVRIRGKVLDDNLLHAFPDLTAAGRRDVIFRMWDHLFLLVCEVAHTPRKIHETNWRHYITLRDSDRLVRLLLNERPTIIVTAHFGNFELAGYVLAVLGFPTHTVARTLDNPHLDRFVNRFRGATGQKMIPKNGGFDQIESVLADAGTMTFLADQYAGTKGCWVEFFGRPVSAHKAIGLLSLSYDAPMTVCSARRVGPMLHVELDTPAAIDPRDTDSHDTDNEIASVRDLTQWYTGHFETFIRRTPGQYWWLHRRWRDTRKPRGRRKAA